MSNAHIHDAAQCTPDNTRVPAGTPHTTPVGRVHPAPKPTIGAHLGGAATQFPGVSRCGAAAGLEIGSRAKTGTVDPSRIPRDTSVCEPRWSSSMITPRRTTIKQEASTPRERASFALKDSRVALAGKIWHRCSPTRSETITCSVEPQRGAKSLDSHRPGIRSRVRAASMADVMVGLASRLVYLVSARQLVLGRTPDNPRTF